jgi:hypothetical protein
MQGLGLKKDISNELNSHPDRIFIKWWRNEHDYINFDLVRKFLDDFDLRTEIGGWELIDQEEMWQTIEKRAEGKVNRVERDGEWVVLWNPPADAEMEQLPEYPYTPETLLKILDAESDNNYVD